MPESTVEVRPAGETARYDLLVSGATAAGLSVAISSLKAGLPRVRIIEATSSVAFPELLAENCLDVGHGETLLSVDLQAQHLIVSTNLHTYLTRACLVAEQTVDLGWQAPLKVPLSDRVRVTELPDVLVDCDVLVVGSTDSAVEVLNSAAGLGGRMVLAAGGMDPAKLSPAAAHMLRRLERERRATVLYRSVPDHIEVVGGFPNAYFNDRRTPDLEFDYVIFAPPRHQPEAATRKISEEALASGQVWFLGSNENALDQPSAEGWEISQKLTESCFPEFPVAPPRSALQRRVSHVGAIEELREEHYNATITHFEPTHSDLWILRVQPDVGDISHAAGQYTSLGLGFWEERIDDAVDDDLDSRWAKLIRRSYSISHSIFDDDGYLADQSESGEFEFYIVLVPPTVQHVPALTPRLALKRPGDRIYLGPKVAGRYTLDAVKDPSAAVVFFSTGTGEAPHNAMIVELLRKGHSGPIVSAVTVRKWSDLGYAEKNRQLENRYSNYHYLAMPTREADSAKRYLQDLIVDGDLERLVGDAFDPASAHMFLCGNPAMIGLPEAGVFPERTGVVELLVGKGFTLDKRGQPGSIHYEEYW